MVEKYYEDFNFRPFRVVDVVSALGRLEKDFDSMDKPTILRWIQGIRKDIRDVYNTQKILEKHIRTLEDETNGN